MVDSYMKCCGIDERQLAMKEISRSPLLSQQQYTISYSEKRKAGVTGEFKGPMLAGAQCDMLCTCIVLRLLVPPPFPPPTVADDIPPSFPSVVPIADKPIDETANDRLPQTAAVLLPNRRGEPKVPAWREAAHRAADEESKFNGVCSSTLALFVTIGIGEVEVARCRPNELLRDINSF
uniref:Uncharacterized protein n=1 Tax=Glossina palpalis gambiensis TaxID=67801 RepID=A0A1B0ASV1_9MUSC